MAVELLEILNRGTDMIFTALRNRVPRRDKKAVRIIHEAYLGYINHTFKTAKSPDAAFENLTRHLTDGGWLIPGSTNPGTYSRNVSLRLPGQTVMVMQSYDKLQDLHQIGPERANDFQMAVGNIRRSSVVEFISCVQSWIPKPDALFYLKSLQQAQEERDRHDWQPEYYQRISMMDRAKWASEVRLLCKRAIAYLVENGPLFPGDDELLEQLVEPAEFLDLSSLSPKENKRVQDLADSVFKTFDRQVIPIDTLMKGTSE